eukprot:scaffold5631_cov117-Cylindrotheca_fusiformis.AAC.2
MAGKSLISIYGTLPNPFTSAFRSTFRTKGKNNRLRTLDKMQSRLGWEDHEIIAKLYTEYNQLFRSQKTKLAADIVQMVHEYGGRLSRTRRVPCGWRFPILKQGIR